MTLQLNSKPKIVIYVTPKSSQTVKNQIGFGIEEEGIPFEFIDVAMSEDLISLAHRASEESSLLVGISVDESKVVLHYRNLPVELFVYKIPCIQRVTEKDLRVLGINAARLVKGIPFQENSAFEVAF